MAKPHIYCRQGWWRVAGNAAVPWRDVMVARAWCDVKNMKGRRGA
jgi:hypothetical protein